MQYFLNDVMQLLRHRREGLLSWKRSPANRMKSTCKQNNIIINNCDKYINNSPDPIYLFIYLYFFKSTFYLLRICTVQDLIQGFERVAASDSILLLVAQVNVRGEQDPEGVLVVPVGNTTPPSPRCSIVTHCASHTVVWLRMKFKSDV